MKVLTKINDQSNIEKYLKYSDGLILGLKDFSVDYYEFTIYEIKDIILNNKDKDIFVAINKNIFNSELEILEQILIELDKTLVSGILFYDMSIPYLKRKNNLKLDLVWNQTHMVTNYNTCNYYYDRGVKYAFVSGEVTLDEIKEINNNTKCDLLMEIVGHQIMSHSRRKLLTNYYLSIGKDYDGDLKEVKESNNSLIVKERKYGTTFKTNTILNAIPYLKDLMDNDITYVVVDEDMIDSNIVIEILKIINNIKNDINIDENISKSYSLIGDNTSFLFKKTIYKVKKDK